MSTVVLFYSVYKGTTLAKLCAREYIKYNMTSVRISSKEANDYIRRSAVNNHAEYLNKTIILSIYTYLPHPPMQNVAFLIQAMVWLCYCFSGKKLTKSSVSLTLLQTKYSA